MKPTSLRRLQRLLCMALALTSIDLAAQAARPATPTPAPAPAAAPAPAPAPAPAAAPVAAAPRPAMAGQLLQTPGQPAIFLVDTTGIKRHVTSMQVATECKLDLTKIQPKTPAELGQVSDGAALTTAAQCYAARGMAPPAPAPAPAPAAAPAPAPAAALAPAAAPKPAMAGQLIQIPSTPAVYLVGAAGNKHAISSQQVAVDCGLDLTKIQPKTAAEMAQISDGSALMTSAQCYTARGMQPPPPAAPKTAWAGQLVQATGQPAVFLVDAAGVRRPLSSAQVGTDCGLDMSSVQAKPAAEITAVTSGAALMTAGECLAARAGTPAAPRKAWADQMVRQTGQAAVYLIGAAGQKHAISSPQVAGDCGLDLAKVQDKTGAELGLISDGAALMTSAQCYTARGVAAPAPKTAWAGQLVNITGQVGVFFVDAAGVRRALSSQQVATDCGLDLSTAQAKPAAEISAVASGGALMTAGECLNARAGTPATPRKAWAGQMVQVAGQPQVFLIGTSGQKHAISSGQVAAACALDLTKVQAKTTAELALVSNGAALMDGPSCLQVRGVAARADLAGQIYQQDGSQNLFLIGKGGFRHQIPSLQMLSQCGLNPNSVARRPASELALIATGAAVAAAKDCNEFLGIQQEQFGTIDPIDVIIKKVPRAAAVLGPLKGVLTLDGASGPNLAAGDVFKLNGTFSPNNVGGSNNSTQAKFARAMIRGAMGPFGIQNATAMELGLSYANLEWDLSLALTISDKFSQTGALIPSPVGFQLASRDAKLILHFKFPVGVPTFTQELAGTFFVRPSQYDPWLALKPTLELDPIQQSVTLGGSMSGACGTVISAATDIDKVCTAKWNVFSLGLVSAAGGTLKLTLDPTKTPLAITGIEAAVKDAFMGSVTGSSIGISGAVLMDVDASPGVGFTFSNTRAIAPGQLLKAMPFGNKEPINSLANALNAVPSSMLPSGRMTVTFAPTGLKVGHIDFKGPTLQMQGDFESVGVAHRYDASFESDLTELMSGNFSKAIQTKFGVGINIKGLNDLVRGSLGNVPVVGPIVNEAMRGFTFKGASVDLNPKSGTGSAKINFVVMGKNFDEGVPLDLIFRPDKTAPWIAKKIEHYAGEAGKIVLKGMENAAKDVAKGATVAAKDFVKGMGVVGNAFEDFGNIVGDAIAGVFKSKPNKYEKTWAAYPYQAMWWNWVRDQYATASNPEKFSLEWDTMMAFHSPYHKEHKLGWSPWFDPHYYLDEYPDVLAEANRNKATLDNELTKEPYDWINPDKFTRDDINKARYFERPNVARPRYQPHQLFYAYKHWMVFGLNEGRIGSPLFNANYYFYSHPDIANAFGAKGPSAAISHYMNSGMKEGRAGAPKAPTNNKVPGDGWLHPCRAIVGGTVLVGSWFPRHNYVTCDIALANGGVAKSPIFDVLNATDYRLTAMPGEPAAEADFAPAVAAYNKDNQAISVCYATATRGVRFGYVTSTGACQIVSDDRTTGVAGVGPQWLSAKGMNWATP